MKRNIFYLQGLMSILALMAGHPAHIQAACSDDFSGTTLATEWTFFDADGDAGSGSVAENGKLELSGRGRDVFKDVNEYVGIKRVDITGDFDISVKIESQTNSHAWAQAGILAATDITKLDQGGYVILDVTPANGYNFFYDTTAPIGGVDKVVSAGKSGYPVWIRLAKKGSAFSAWYKNDLQATWTQIAKDLASLGAAAPSQIALFSLSHSTTQDAKTVFDDFECLHAPTTAIGSNQKGMVPNAKTNTDPDALGRLHGKPAAHGPLLLIPSR